MRINPVSTNYISRRQIEKYPINGQKILSHISQPDEAVQNVPAYFTQVNFKSSSELKTLIQNLPFEDRLAIALRAFSKDEVLVVSNNFQKSLDAIKHNIFSYKYPIKVIAFMEEPDLKETLFFTGKGAKKRFEFFNVNSSPIRANAFDEIEPADTYELSIGDHLYSSGLNWFQLKYDVDLSIVPEYLQPLMQKKIRSEMFKVYSFKEEYNRNIEKFNEKILKSLNEVDAKQDKNKVVTFKDVGGQDKAIKQIKRNLVFPLIHPEAYKDGYKNKGVILYGPPGTGKSLLAEAVGNEVNVSFFSVGGTDFNDKYVGESEKAFEEQVQKAIDAQPSILFIDEVDSLARQRGSIDIHGDKLLNKVLHSMTRLQNEEVYLIAATNNIDLIDKAFLRSGRFGARILVDAPDIEGVEQIFNIHIKDKLDENLDKEKLFKSMHDLKMVGADIAIMIKEARDNAFIRTGIEDAMEDGTYTPLMLEYLELNQVDFDAALDNFKNRNKSARKQIGY